MALKETTNFVDLVAGQRSPAAVMQIAHTLQRIDLRFSGDLVVTGALTLVEDGVLNIAPLIELKVGGVNVKVIGDGSGLGAGSKILYYDNQALYGTLPILNQVLEFMHQNLPC